MEAGGGRRPPGGSSKHAAVPGLLRRMLSADRPRRRGPGHRPYLRCPWPLVAAAALRAAVVLAIPVIFSAIAVLLAMPGLIAMARRKTAFRADYAGITLSAPCLTNLASLRGSPVFTPWADV